MKSLCQMKRVSCPTTPLCSGNLGLFSFATKVVFCKCRQCADEKVNQNLHHTDCVGLLTNKWGCITAIVHIPLEHTDLKPLWCIQCEYNNVSTATEDIEKSDIAVHLVIAYLQATTLLHLVYDRSKLRVLS